MIPLDSDHLHEAVGGRAELMCRWQFEWLLEHGLEPRHRLLDLGSGTLRGGRAFIAYLNAGNYFGVEPLERLLESSRQLAKALSLTDKSPRLGGFELLDARTNTSFDFVLTQSVLNHLDEKGIRATVDRVARALATDGTWLTTVKLDDDASPVSLKNPHPNRPGEWQSTGVHSMWFKETLRSVGLVPVSWGERAHPAGLDTIVVRRLPGQNQVVSADDR